MGAVVVAVAALAVVLLRPGGSDYVVHAQFQNASQLVKGDLVQVAGAPIGKVKAIKLTDDGKADIKMAITDDRYKPLRDGTRALIRQASLSGVANRYIDLQLAPDSAPKIDSGGLIPESRTTTAVDLDQLFNTFDPKTRDALRRLIRGYGTAYGGRGKETNLGWLYLNPSLAASSRLFEELNHDTPLLRDFVVDSSKLVTTIAERRNDLSALIENLAKTTGALGRQKTALADAIHTFPDFMRRSNTTFVNLRATLDDLTGLINDTKPVTPKLRRFVAELRPLAIEARPTLRDLSALIQKKGKSNDLIELTNSSVPVRDIGVGPIQRNGKMRQGALPASTDALRQSIDEVSYARPYAVDLVGWFDDFSHSGVYDALGGGSRAAAHVNLPTSVGAVLPNSLGLKDMILPLVNGQAVSLNQRNRCPGAIERDSYWKPTPDYPCDASQVPIGQ